jgi:hypothetical protein
MVEIWCDNPRLAAQSVKGTGGVSRINVYGDRLHIMIDDDTAIAGIIAMMKEAKLGVKDYRRVLPSIEDVFISMVESKGTSGK